MSEKSLICFFLFRVYKKEASAQYETESIRWGSSIREDTLKHTSAFLSLIHPRLSETSSVDIAAYNSFTQASRVSTWHKHLILR